MALNNYKNMGFGETFADWLGLGSADRERQFNSAEAQKQRNWETQMSNSAHQREVADLKKAGLNPILSATGGTGSSTPTGSSASSHAASRGNGISQIAAGINSAANMVNAFNRDKNKSNDLTGNSAVKLVTTLAKLFG